MHSPCPWKVDGQEGRDAAILLFIQWSIFQLIFQFGFPSSCFHCSSSLSWDHLEFCYTAQASLYHCIPSYGSRLLWFVFNLLTVLSSSHLLEIYWCLIQEYFSSHYLPFYELIPLYHILWFQEEEDRNAGAKSTNANIWNQKYCSVRHTA